MSVTAKHTAARHTSPAARAGRRWIPGAATAIVGLLTLHPAAALAQTTGKILGRVLEEGTGTPIATAELRVVDTQLRTLSSDEGDFILVAVPVGRHELRAERLGFRPVVVPIRVRPGRTTQLEIEMPPAAVEVEGVTAEVERQRLIEPEVIVTHEVVLGTQLRQLPVDEIEEAVELTTGVADGHFRGGRVGQETYRIDGLDVKNQFEASRTGQGLELSPTSLEEVDVVTGGFSADNGSALSGVVSYTTRRGDPERWEGLARVLSDHWAPDGLFRGFSSFSVSAGGPIGFLGEGSTVFADVLAQGFVDSEPHARGLTCVTPDDAADQPQLVDAINELRTDPLTRHLYCPFTEDRLPFQRGDKLIGFARIDRPLNSSTTLTATLLHNRRQNELFTSEFKYNPDFQLGQRTRGWLGTLTLDWSKHVAGRAYHVVARGALFRLDRYLGVVDPATFDGRTTIAGFGIEDFQFLGEDFVRSDIRDQLDAGIAVPGYRAPGGTTGSPFGPAAEGLFFTEGTPTIASWNTSEFVGGDLRGEVLTTSGHSLRAGTSVRFYRNETYERVAAHLPGSSPTFARFFPKSVESFAELSLLAAHDVTVRFGLRLETFQSGLAVPSDPADFLSPGVDTEWKTSFMPRLGVAVPLPGTDQRTMFRFNYGLLAQPPDFTFFVDNAIGDSLRTDVRRQGNPNLSFEEGNSWEVGISHLVNRNLSVSVTGFYKELTNLVTSSLTFSGIAPGTFTTGDFGSVKGVELAAQAHLPWARLRAGYALQEAKGVSSTAFEDPIEGLTERRIEFPLAFDRRHTADFTAFLGQAAGFRDTRWSGSLTAQVRSGFPLDRRLTETLEPAEGGGTITLQDERLPWTGLLNLRVGREIGGLPVCGGCTLRVLADLRNFIDRDNVVALRRDTGTLAPPLNALSATAAQVPEMEPIPRESPDYSSPADLDQDGLITTTELRRARFAAALDRNDPSLFFGRDSGFRIGLEVTF